MNAKKCDRCGVLFERPYVPDITIHSYRHPYGEDRLDLCDSCQHQLEEWLSYLHKSFATSE